jgi:hypothetical protein
MQRRVVLVLLSVLSALVAGIAIWWMVRSTAPEVSEPAGPRGRWVVVPTSAPPERPDVVAQPEDPPPIEPPPFEAVPDKAPALVAPAAAKAAPEEDPEEAPWPLDARGIKGAMKAHLGEIRECYEGWLLEQPDLAGTIVVEIELAGEPDAELATVTGVSVESDLAHEPMDACVLNVVESIPFDPPPGGRFVFRYPFVFEAD